MRATETGAISAVGELLSVFRFIDFTLLYGQQ
jgi:hypothetical protein